MPRHGPSRRDVLSGMGGFPLASATPVEEGLVLSVADFGVLPGVNDAGPGVRTAILRMDKRPGSTLRFPPGIYRFAAQDGVAMSFDGMDRLTLEGEGATLVFEGRVAPLLIKGCKAPLVRGLTFDWERPPFSQGEVIGVGLDQRSVTLRIDPEFPVDGSEQIQQLGTYNRATRAMTAGGIDAGGSVAGVLLVGAQTLYLTLTRPLPFRLGDTVVARHGHGQHVLQIQRCQDFSLEDVTIYAGPAMAIAIGGCDGGTTRRVNVQQRPGSGRLMSTNADAFHCTSCSGDIKVTECNFAGMGDDGINVTGAYLTVTPSEDHDTWILGGGRYPSSIMDIGLRKGDRLALISGKDLRSIGEIEIDDVKPLNNRRWSIQGKNGQLLPAGEPVFAMDLRARPRLLVSDCSFLGNRARGVLAHSDAIIERCKFQYQSASAVLLAPDLFWQEGPAVKRTIVRSNHIQATNLSGTVPAAVWIDAFVSPEGRQGVETSEVVNKDIEIEDNVFVQPNGPAVAAVSTANLRIENNQIHQASSVGFIFRNVLSVRVARNQCDPSAKIQIDSVSRRELTVESNIGIQAI